MITVRHVAASPQKYDLSILVWSRWQCYEVPSKDTDRSGNRNKDHGLGYFQIDFRGPLKRDPKNIKEMDNHDSGHVHMLKGVEYHTPNHSQDL